VVKIIPAQYMKQKKTTNKFFELIMKNLLNIQSKKQPPKLEQVMQNQLKLNQRDNHQELS
jgi:flagellar motor component MotA